MTVTGNMEDKLWEVICISSLLECSCENAYK